MTNRADDGPKAPPRVLCILATQRTGSTLLVRVLSRDPAFRATGEVFHAHSKRSLTEAETEAFAGRAGSAEAIVRWRAENPGATIDLLRSMRPSGTLLIKVMPRQVEPGILRAELLERSDTAFVVLTRRPIDSFISAMKARHFGGHHCVDTTAFRPELDAGVFEPWARRHREWYRWIDVSLEQIGVAPVRIAYERSLAADPWSTAQDVAARVGLDFRPASREIPLFRQDRTESFRDRVANWDSFAAALDPDLLAWAIAEGPPATGGR